MSRMCERRLVSAGILIILLCCPICCIDLTDNTQRCDMPPEFWCSTPDVARRCRVEKQCAQNVWFPSSINNVQLGLYYETLCPDCKEFIQSQLFPAHNKLANIIDLQLVPYGNAYETQVGDKWQFTCQHGADECEGNLIQTCSIYVLKNMSAIFPFVACMEMSDELPRNSAPLCAKKFGIDFDAILQCTKSPLGNQLQHEMAVLTDRLDPPHNFVPWITLNGVHTDEIQHQAENDLTKLICDTYQGPKPDVCKTMRRFTYCWKK